jgi:hypothetical protein
MRTVSMIVAAALLVPLGSQAEERRFPGMPASVTSGQRPDLALQGGGLNDRDGGNALRNASAGAGAAAAPGPQPFDAHDLDVDGFVSKAEAAGHEQLVREFDRADRNKDGRLSKAEYARHEKRIESRRARRARSK